jgi:alcohol dehydrogenase class IV
MNASVLIGTGARHGLRALVLASGQGPVLVVASPGAMARCGVESALDGADLHVFSGFTPNPQLDDVLVGVAVRLRVQPAMVVAVGGGSAIDTAKLIRSLPPGRADATDMLAGVREPPAGRPAMIAVPTTAGSGSEVTRFATVYVDGRKASLDHRTVRPDHALVDPDLLLTCPARLTYACAFDCLCHAVESYWSRRATATSRMLALRALHGVVRALTGVPDGTPPRDTTGLATAATTAGRAIDITRTTAAHAFSYRLTARFGVPHGVACLLNLRWLISHHSRSVPGLRRELAVIADALDPIEPGAGPPAVLAALLRRGGYPLRLRDYGVDSRDIPDLVDAGLSAGRVTNHPVALDRAAVSAELQTLF